MAYNTAPGRAEYTASAAQDVFTYAFKIYSDTDIKVYLTPSGNIPNDVDDLLILTADYTVVIDGDNGGTITLVAPASVGDSVTLVRSLPRTRATDYQQNGDLSSDTLDEDQNYQTYLIADAELNTSNRSITIPESLQGFDTVLPNPVAEGYIRFAADGKSFVNDDTAPQFVTDAETAKTGAETAQTAAELAETNAETAEANSQLRAWESEAEKLTADSYATEAEDTFVNIVTSDGDGTFTYTPTTEYSSLHHSAKAALSNPANYYLKTEVDAKQVGKNLIINNGLVNQLDYVSGTSTTTANEFTIDLWRVITLGESLVFSTTNNATTFTAPLNGVAYKIKGENIKSGTYVVSGLITATCTVDGVAKTNGDTFTLVGGTDCEAIISNGTFLEFQIEPGAVPTAFEVVSKEDVLERCKYYLEKIPKVRAGGNDFVGVYRPATSNWEGKLSYKEKQRTPSITISGVFVQLDAALNIGLGTTNITTTHSRIFTTTNYNNAISPIIQASDSNAFIVIDARPY